MSVTGFEMIQETDQLDVTRTRERQRKAGRSNITVGRWRRRAFGLSVCYSFNFMKQTLEGDAASPGTPSWPGAAFS